MRLGALALPNRPGAEVWRQPLWQRPVLVLAALLTSACGSVVEVRPMATGRIDVAAYELRGGDLVLLKREAHKQCPQGADILRQAGRSEHRPAPPAHAGRLRRWAHAGGDWLAPPKRDAQLVVVCKESPGDLLLPAEAEAAADPGGEAAAAATPAPITVQW